jgi:hypothetical protein
MKTKLKHCDGHGGLAVIWKYHEGKRYCKQCWNKRTGVLKPSVVKPTSKKLPRQSAKRKADDRQYSLLRKEFLLSSPICTAHIPNICTYHATDIHHKKGRSGTLFLDTRYWMAVCRACHSWVDLNSAAAEDLGFTIKRSTP